VEPEKEFDNLESECMNQENKIIELKQASEKHQSSLHDVNNKLMAMIEDLQTEADELS